MADIKTITPDNSGFPAFLDFTTLRAEGIKHIAAFSGNLWTDHNLHDPGITMLEALCYVLSDLDYRTRLDFQDLVARDPQDTSPDNNFFTPAQILGNNPLTITDYRKLLIDINGVRNAWLEKAGAATFSLSFNCGTGQLQNTPLLENTRRVPLLGLYNVVLETDDVYAATFATDACGNNQFALDKVIGEVNSRLHSHRNLCEDFADILILQDEPISLCMHLELQPGADPDAVLTGIFSSIQDFFSPAPSFYTLPQMLDKGLTMDAIMEGRPYDFVKNQSALRNGFIDTTELELLQRHTCIHASDLYRLIMSVNGVAGVTRLVMYSNLRPADPARANDPSEKKFAAGEEWCLHLENGHRPVLSPDQSNIIFYKNNLPLYADISKVTQQYVRNITDYHKSAKEENLLDHLVPKGRYMDLSQYRSVQYEFPVVYGIGKAGLPNDAPAERRAQALQLQAYLLFYDQLLGDYFAQLSHIRPLFALSAGVDDPFTYFTATMAGVPQIAQLLHYEGALSGTYQPGDVLAFPALSGGVHYKQFPTVALRGEAMDYIRQQCGNDSVQIETTLYDTATYGFSITAASGDILLESKNRYPTELQAKQAANDVIYLAAGDDAYSVLNNRTQGQYSFNIVYNGNGSTKNITDLYESTGQYQVRKERFLDHLLARFSEDFTDYVLMMYALNGKQNDPVRNIQDKAALLGIYPQVSANRSLAFDYRAYRDGFPQSGLQQRVYSLMGISTAPVHSLNNFDLVQTASGWQFFVYLPGDGTGNTPLFTGNYYPSQSAATAAYSALIALAGDIDNYHAFGCGGDQVYGFRVQSPPGAETAVWATSCLQFSDACTRDEMMAWLARFFAGNGHYTQYIVAEEGYYFLFLDDDQQVLLKSRKGYDTSEAAFSAGCDALQALQDSQNYQVVSRPETADYVVQTPGAQTPAAYTDPATAQQALEKLQAYFLGKSLYYVEDATPTFQWQLSYNAAPAWESAALFNTAAQLPAAFYQFLGSAAVETNYRVTPGFQVQVVQTQPTEEDTTSVTILANGLTPYDSETAARQAIPAMAASFRRMLQTISAAVKSVTAHVYDFNDPDTSAPLLTTTQPVPEGPARAQQLRRISVACADADCLRVTLQEDGCFYIVQVIDEDGVLLAESPLQDSEAAASLLLRKILLLAQQQLLLYEKRAAVPVFKFEWPSVNDTTLCYSIAVWEQADAAATALLEWILASTMADLHAAQWGDGSYGFTVQLPSQPPLARSAIVYPTPEARDQAMTAVFNDITILRDGLQWQSLTSHRYYFQVKDSDDILLQEAQSFSSLDTVRHGFYDTIQLGKERHYYTLTDNDGCTYSFILNDAAGQLLSIHPHDYFSTAERDAALQRVINFLQTHGQDITIRQMPGVWRFAWQWLSCCQEPEVALAGIQDLPDQDAAQTLLQQVLSLATSAGHYESVQNNGQWQVFLKNDAGVRLAVHPPVFTRAYAADLAIQRLVTWAAYNPLTLTDGIQTTNTITNDLPYDASAPLAGRLGYRLWNRDERIAQYLPVFESIAERNAALDQLNTQYHQYPPAYTALEMGNGVVLPSGDVFYFQLRSKGRQLWQSMAAYDTADLAMQAFETQYLGILHLAKDTRHYSAFDATASKLYLLDKKQQPVAFLSVVFSTKAEHDEKVQQLVQAALAYPIVRKGPQYAFHLYNADTHVYEWASTHTWTTAADALEQFQRFLQSLHYKGNYCLDNYVESCRYEITLAAVLLYSNDFFVNRDKDKQLSDGEDNAWALLDDFLLEIQKGDDIYYRYIDYANGCRYAFRVVNSDQYRVARHTGWYQSLQAREAARRLLICDIHCLARLYAYVITPHVNTIADQLASYFTDATKLTLDKVWSGLDLMPRGAQWITKRDPEDEMYYYQLEVTDAAQADMQLPGELYKKVIWRSVNGYFNECDALAAEQYFYIYILEMARVPAGYWYAPVPFRKCEYTLALKDMTGKVIATAPGIVCEADLETHRNTRVVNAMLYPIMESLTGGYQFEINNITQDETGFSFDTIWQSVPVYNDPEAAFAGLETATTLLLNAGNYQRLSPDDCGPYGIELTDPDFVMAQHPFSYTNRADCEAAITAVKAAISTEGFHLLEHILLRPRQPQLTQEILQLSLPLAEGQGSAPLGIQALTVYDNHQQFLQDLQAASVYRNGNDLVWIDAQQVLIAQANLPATPTEVDWLTQVKDQLANAGGTFSTITTTTGGDALLPLCEGVDICNANTDEEDAAHCDLTFLADPYSFQATVVIPSWPKRFQVPRFRQFFEDTLRKEAPAHLQLRIIWVSPRDMHRFEADYRNWLSVFAAPDDDTADGFNSCRYQQYLQALITTLTSIRNEYPPAILPEKDGDTVLLLDETVIG